MDPYKEEIFVIFIEDIFVSPTIFASPCVLLFSLLYQHIISMIYHIFY